MQKQDLLYESHKEQANMKKFKYQKSNLISKTFKFQVSSSPEWTEKEPSTTPAI